MATILGVDVNFSMKGANRATGDGKRVTFSNVLVTMRQGDLAHQHRATFVFDTSTVSADLTPADFDPITEPLMGKVFIGKGSAEKSVAFLVALEKEFAKMVRITSVAAPA